MSVDESEAVELCRRGAFTDATEWILRRYGQELLTYLYALERSSDEADDVFSELCAALWQSLPRFRFECSLRTYAYALARRTRAHAIRTRARRAEVATPPELEQIAAHVRTTTAEYMRTTARDRFEHLREQLDDEERTLLILRLNRKLGWLEIARIMSDAETAPELAKKAAAVRKRYERIKDQLRRELRGP
jgi:RNA polymerase sigma-70 factor (ECF subfamily)